MAEPSVGASSGGTTTPSDISGGVPAPMLARLERTLPRGDHWRYEPKLDGFRGLWQAPAGSAHGLQQEPQRPRSCVSRACPRRRRAGPGTLLDREIVIAY